MTKRWRIHEETLAEIDASVAWYDEQRAGLGLEFLSEIRRTLTELRATPRVSTPDRSATIWGWGAYAGYAYPGGMAFRKLVETPLSPVN